MKHPLENIPVTSRKPSFWAFLAGTVILFAVFWVLDAPLKTSSAPYGIVSFELAGTSLRAEAILNSWRNSGLQNLGSDPGIVNRETTLAAFSLGIDYLFMPVYAFALALGILLAASKHKGWFAVLGAWLGWGAFAAALFDAVENYALVRILLLNEVQSPYPEVAAVCASIKFGLLLVGLLYSLVGWVWLNKGNNS